MIKIEIRETVGRPYGEPEHQEPKFFNKLAHGRAKSSYIKFDPNRELPLKKLSDI